MLSSSNSVENMPMVPRFLHSQNCLKDLLLLFSKLVIFYLIFLLHHLHTPKTTFIPNPDYTPTTPPPPLISLSHLFFSIAAASSSFSLRLPYINLWYKPNSTNAVIFLDTPISSTPSVSSPPILVSSELRIFLILSLLIAVQQLGLLVLLKVDVRGDLVGILLHIHYHLYYHFITWTLPLFPGMTRIAASEHLFQAVHADPARIFQQTVCYDKPNLLTVSVACGYAVQVFEGNELLPDLLSRQPTFRPFKRGKNVAAKCMFNTRVFPGDPCKRPAVFFWQNVFSSRDGIWTEYI